ncbi:hypothetical protein JCM11491_002454 [Sporobolomyces phaffii]
MPSSSPLPSLLRNLTASSSRSSASVSLDSPATSAPSNDDAHSVASNSSRSKPQRRRRVVTDPVARSSPTSSRTRTPTDVHTFRRGTDTPSEGARSRSSSGSSLEGLTARLHGARRGKTEPHRNGQTRQVAPEVQDDDDDNDVSTEKGKGRATGTERDGKERRNGRDDAQRSELASVPTISLSPDQVESQHGHTRVVTPDLNEPPPPLSVPSPAESPALSTRSSAFDPNPLPPRIKVNEDDAAERPGDKEPTTTTFASSPSLSDLSDEGNDSSLSPSDDEPGSDSRSLNLVSRAESHRDPRDLLRSQLAKAESGHHTIGDDDRRLEQERRVAMNRTSSGLSQRSTTAVTEEGPCRPVRTYEKRRYFILSTAGKLVYTSDADEDMASGLVGVMQAIVSIFADEGDKIRCVEVGDAKITFLLKSPLYLVVSSSWGEPESVLRTHLDYLYLQVLSVVTLTQLQSIFSRRSNFDLRRMMEGTEPFFHSIVNSMQTSVPILTSSIEVYRLDPHVRTEIAKALDPGREVTKKLDLLYVLLLARGRLVTLLRPKKHSIHPTDLHLLLSTIYSSRPRSRRKSTTGLDPTADGTTGAESDRDGVVEEEEDQKEEDWTTSPLAEPGLESWLPICLPRFNAKGFLHAYVSFFAPSTSAGDPPSAPEGGGRGGGIGLVLLSSDREGFVEVKGAAEGIKERLLSATGSGGDSKSTSTLMGATPARAKNRKGGKAGGGLVHEIEKARSLQEYSLGELAIPGLRHFVYKSRALVQSTRPAWERDYLLVSDRYRLITLYQRLSDALHPRPAQSGTAARKPAQVQYLRTEREAVLGWSTPQFELYLATSPQLPHSAVVSAAKAVSKWVEREESRLFLTNSPSF